MSGQQSKLSTNLDKRIIFNDECWRSWPSISILLEKADMTLFYMFLLNK